MGHVIEIDGYSLFIHKCYALHTDLRELGLLSWLLKQVLNFLRADFNLIDAALLRRFVYLRCYYLIQAYGNIIWILDQFRELLYLVFDGDFDGFENIWTQNFCLIEVLRSLSIIVLANWRVYGVNCTIEKLLGRSVKENDFLVWLGNNEKAFVHAVK